MDWITAETILRAEGYDAELVAEAVWQVIDAGTELPDDQFSDTDLMFARYTLLIWLGNRWREARTAERERMGAVYDAVRAAVGAGMPQTEAAEAAGVDRMTVRRALGKGRR